MKLNLINRKASLNQFSIERVYNTLKDSKEVEFHLTTIEVPSYSTSVLNIFRNVFFARKFRNQLNHITGDINYVSLFLDGGKMILTIHDMLLFNSSKGIKGWFVKKIWFEWPMKKASKIITISKFSYDEIIRVFPQFKSKLIHIYNPLNPSFSYSPKKHNETNEFKVLAIGTKENKNLQNLIKASKGLNLKLAIVGKLNDFQHHLLEENEIKYENFIDLANEELNQQYINSDMVSFISTYEGFGLPIIEAQSVGRPVLTSNIGAMKEIAGNGAYFVDPYAVLEIRKGIQDICKDMALREMLIKEGRKNIERFKAEDVARKYKLVYQELMDGKF